MTEIIPILPGLSPVGGKEIGARFDGCRLCSDGGALLQRAVEAVWRPPMRTGNQTGPIAVKRGHSIAAVNAADQRRPIKGAR